ncbi:putative phosphinothricin N-acetyltransferase [Hyaloraphidium curvatum]|nr:putative phosphinothricin N-acetyltransferase [Hyaloraphidium curvatum]
MEIRDAAAGDIPAITAIYASHVLHGTGTFEEIPPSESDMLTRMEGVQSQGWPWLVAEDASGVLGYAYFAQFRPRSAYRHTAENAIYVRADAQRRGVGGALLRALLERAEKAGFRQILAVIGDSGNAGSIGLHGSLGFRHVGVFKSVGLKFGRWLDVVMMQKELGEGHATMPS